MPWVFRILVVGLAGFLLIQLVPYGRDHDNPATAREPAWDTDATRNLAVRACFDCHSNVTEWPWYTDVAPVSWLVQHDVDEGRQALDFSEWQRPQKANLAEVVEALREREMPPRYYRVLHADARLSATERQDLEQGLTRTWAATPPARGG